MKDHDGGSLHGDGNEPYGVDTISRLLKIQVSFAEYSLFYLLFCKRDL